ncbi:MAG: hypothetical protein A2096_16265 [Spirochaetes bacterium GWF1_41_5]|nr:MAG: hypothetical protein A2096_16265 [Spirochaetes bacterium GWF1_41_5]HBE03831.1 hypothetical protein [Spirochaetia bacterium]
MKSICLILFFCACLSAETANELTGVDKNTYFELGSRLIDEDNYGARLLKEADKCCEEGIKFFKIRDYDRATSNWNQALKIKLDHELSSRYLDKLSELIANIDTYTKEGENAIQAGNFQDAVKAFTGVLTFNSQDPGAARHLKKIADSLPVDKKQEIIESCLPEADALFNSSGYDDAFKSLAKYITILFFDSGHAVALERIKILENRIVKILYEQEIKEYFEYAELKMTETRYEEAIFYFKKVLALDVENKGAREKSGEALRLLAGQKIEKLLTEIDGLDSLGLIARAMITAQKIFEIDPQSTRADEKIKTLAQKIERRPVQNGLYILSDNLALQAVKKNNTGLTDDALALLFYIEENFGFTEAATSCFYAILEKQNSPLLRLLQK